MKTGNGTYGERRGVRPISWEEFHGLCKGLATALAEYNPTIILGIARGGLYPATLISQLLQKELYPIRLTRRNEDIIKYEHPIWLLKPPSAIKGLRVLAVDEICDTGETLQMVKDEVLFTGASEVKTAVLYSHKKSQHLPDFIGIVSDELFLNPWDREIWQGSGFIFHPEYQKALEMQGVSEYSSFLPKVRIERLAKAKG